MRTEDKNGTVYLLHFAEPVSHAQHYLGWTLADVATDRVQEHLDGQGSPLVRAAVDRGIEVDLVRTWPGTPLLEKELKQRKNSRGLCPLCLPDLRRRAREQDRERRRRRNGDA